MEKIKEIKVSGRIYGAGEKLEIFKDKFYIYF